MSSSFYGPGAFHSFAATWDDEGEEPEATASTRSAVLAAAQQPQACLAPPQHCSVDSEEEAETPRRPPAGPPQPGRGGASLEALQPGGAEGNAAAKVPLSAGLSSYSSFYPKSGAVGNSGATVPELPWTRRERPATDCGERPSSRERRHRSSWHAALNRRIVALEDAEDLLAMVNRELNGFDVLNTVTSLNRLSRLSGARRFQRDPRALEVLYRIEAWLTRASAPGSDKEGPEAVLSKHLASIAVGLARLQWKDSTAGRILRMIGFIAPELLHMSRARDLSNLAWAFATLDMRGFDSVLLAIAREAVAQIADFTEQNLSNTCWAYAKIGLRHDPLIKAIADETVRKLPQFSAQGLSNTLWGFATLVIKGEECLGQSAWQLICALLEELTLRLPDCPTQQISNSAWACCRLGVRHDGFMAAVAAEGMRKLPNYTPQDLANTAMAFAKPNIRAEAFLKALAAEAARKMRNFEAREVSNITWSLNIMGPGIIDQEWLEPALRHFRGLVRLDFGSRSSSSRRDGDFEGWEMVQLLNACWAYRATLAEWGHLADTFREHIYGPVVRALAAIVGRGPWFAGPAARRAGPALAAPGAAPAAGGERSPGSAEPAPNRLYNAGPATSAALAAAACPPPALEPLDAARQEAQRVAEELQVDFLGPVFTRAALRDLGFVDPADTRAAEPFSTSEPEGNIPVWGHHARAAVEKALAKMRADLPFMWFDRFGPHERRVQCWLSYELEVEAKTPAGSLRSSLAEGGRIADFSLDEHRAMCQHGQETLARLEAAKGQVLFTLQDVRRAQGWLHGLFAQHDRTGHCERQALLEVALEVIGVVRGFQQSYPAEAGGLERCVTEGCFDGSSGVVVRGQLRLFVCHFYCISCLAALSNFARRFPEVTLQTDYDDCWKTRLLDV